MASLNKNNCGYFSGDKRENQIKLFGVSIFDKMRITSSYSSSPSNLKVPPIDGIECHLSSFASIRLCNLRNVNK